jgi:predicted TPR repeat methyltransferase
MTSTARTYFEEMYQRSADPWDFAHSEYESRKYALTVASLPKDRYANAFEPGCSIGVLTEHLAPRCHRLLAADMMGEPLILAADRLDAYPNVQVEVRTIPDEWPDEIFDLVVLSEVAYYFDVETLSRITELVVASTVVGAHVVGVHWRGRTDYPLTGDGAHAVIDQQAKLALIVHHVEDDFVLDVWERLA